MKYISFVDDRKIKKKEGTKRGNINDFKRGQKRRHRESMKRGQKEGKQEEGI